jgi:tetratricopeptide (TPR) repeat protein
LALSKSYWKQDDLEESENILKKSLDLLPQRKELLYELIRIYIYGKKYDLAIDNINKILLIDREEYLAYFYLIQIYDIQNKYKEIIDLYENSFLFFSQYKYSLYMVSDTYLKLNEYDKALLVLNKTINKDSEFYLKIANIKGLQAKKEEAISFYKKSLEIDSKNYDAYIGLGKIYYSENDIDRAIFYFTSAMEIRPDLEDSYLNLSLIYLRKNQIKDSISIYQKLIEVKRDNPEYYYNLACLYAMDLNKDEAIFYLEKSIVFDSKYIKFAKENISFSFLLKDKDFKYITSDEKL